MRMWTTASFSWGDSMPEPFLRNIIMLFELEAFFQTPVDRIVKKEWNINLNSGGRLAFCRCCSMNDWINPFPSSSTFSSSITLSAIWGGEVSIDLIIFHLADYLQTWSYSSWVIIFRPGRIPLGWSVSLSTGSLAFQDDGLSEPAWNVIVIIWNQKGWGQRYFSDKVGPFLRERGHQQVARLSQADARDQVPFQRGQQKLLLITMFQMVMNC